MSRAGTNAGWPSRANTSFSRATARTLPGRTPCAGHDFHQNRLSLHPVVGLVDSPHAAMGHHLADLEPIRKRVLATARRRASGPMIPEMSAICLADVQESHRVDSAPQARSLR